MRFLVLACFLLAGATPAHGQGLPKDFKATTHRVWRPFNGGHFVHFMPRQQMKKKGERHFSLAAVKGYQAPVLPIDWAKALVFPMDLNDQLGDCYYAAGCHADNTWTGNVGTESFFSLAAIRSRYVYLSGGDNGLNDSDMQGEMKNRYLADVPEAKIVDFMDISVTDATAVQSAMADFGVIVFTFDVANAWINNSSTGTVWDAGVNFNGQNGHAVIWNGTAVNGNYKLQTWGTWVWITPAGVRACDPAGWIAFSERWFNAKGYAPNSLHITDLAARWVERGGRAIPANVIAKYPPKDGPPPPPPPPPPAPGIVTFSLSAPLNAGTYKLMPPGTIALPESMPPEIVKFLQEVYGPKTVAAPAKKQTEAAPGPGRDDYAREILRALQTVNARLDRLDKSSNQLGKRLADLPMSP